MNGLPINRPEAIQKRWVTRRARLGPSGNRPEVLQASAARMHQALRTDPGLRARRTEKVIDTWIRKMEARPPHCPKCGANDWVVEKRTIDSHRSGTDLLRCRPCLRTRQRDATARYKARVKTRQAKMAVRRPARDERQCPACRGTAWIATRRGPTCARCRRRRIAQRRRPRGLGFRSMPGAFNLPLSLVRRWNRFPLDGLLHRSLVLYGPQTVQTFRDVPSRRWSAEMVLAALHRLSRHGLVSSTRGVWSAVARPTSLDKPFWQRFHAHVSAAPDYDNYYSNLWQVEQHHLREVA